MTARRPQKIAATQGMPSEKAPGTDIDQTVARGAVAPLCRYEELAERENRLRAAARSPD